MPVDAYVCSDELYQKALLQPVREKPELDTLRIVSGYATSAMAFQHQYDMTKNIKHALNVDLVYGMAGMDGVSKINHMGFISLNKHEELDYKGTFDCSYVKKPRSVHSKVYVWCKGLVPVKAFIGSANYTENGFSMASRTETLAECDPVTAMGFFGEIRKGAIPCGIADRDKDFSTSLHGISPAKPSSPVITIETNPESPFKGCEKVVLSLLTKENDPGNGSRLNWGVRPDGSPRVSGTCSREPNQAYIGLPSSIYRTEFFPPIGQRFTVLTDDDQIFTFVRAQENGKCIETPHNNSEIGRYFRKRLGLSLGSYVSTAAFKRYGRYDVTFYKLDDENYVMDFSKP